MADLPAWSTGLLERFLRYVQVDTQADETSSTVPSTAKQLDLSRMLLAECRELGLEDASLSPEGVVMATVPATVSYRAPAIAFVSHVDTSPEFSGTGVKPQVVRDYAGGNLTLPGDPSRVLRPSEQPELLSCIGHTLITSDGTTLLGADDKAGIAVIMTMAERLMQDRDHRHGPVRVCFTCDEEIGRGTDHLDLAALGAICGYTLDGGGQGEIDAETFSADQAVVTIRGVNTHPSVGKGVMVNAVRLMSEFLSRLPTSRLSPESSAGREGFIHPYHVEGGVAESTARLILRDFETEQLSAQAALLESIATTVRALDSRAEVTVTIRPQYRNFREGLAKEPRALQFAEAATRAAGLEPKLSIVRGGTDGSLLTAKGLPCPNLSTGQHHPHSPLEWASLNEMAAAVQVTVELTRLWGQERL